MPLCNGCTRIIKQDFLFCSSCWKSIPKCIRNKMYPYLTLCAEIDTYPLPVELQIRVKEAIDFLQKEPQPPIIA